MTPHEDCVMAASCWRLRAPAPGRVLSMMYLGMRHPKLQICDVARPFGSRACEPRSENIQMAVFDVSICMDKPTVRIDDWAVVPNPASGKYQVLRPGALLVGRAFGHPKMK